MKLKVNFNNGEAGVIDTDEIHKPSETESILVPVIELKKLEQSRVELYEFLKGRLSGLEVSQLSDITHQIWKVANTKKMDE